jgi:hypothetical protein
VGSAACRPCHLPQYEQQSKSGHFRALSKAKPEDRADWAFGSGLQAITYVARSGPEQYTELGLSWFRKPAKLDLTPGHATAKGQPYSVFSPGAEIMRCFQCHSTGPVNFTPEHGLQPFEPGVRCEVCHGPGSEHAKNPKQTPFKPSMLNGAGVNEFCGNCHRMPPAAGTATDFSNPWNVRHQPVYLSQSRCFNESRGRLTCFTCHSPHETVSREAAAYDSACLTCHQNLQHKPLAAKRPCAGCHMPAVQAGPHLQFANHWIRK